MTKDCQNSGCCQNSFNCDLVTALLSIVSLVLHSDLLLLVVLFSSFSLCAHGIFMSQERPPYTLHHLLTLMTVEPLF